MMHPSSNNCFSNHAKRYTASTAQESTKNRVQPACIDTHQTISIIPVATSTSQSPELESLLGDPYDLQKTPHSVESKFCQALQLSKEASIHWHSCPAQSLEYARAAAVLNPAVGAQALSVLSMNSAKCVSLEAGIKLAHEALLIDMEEGLCAYVHLALYAAEQQLLTQSLELVAVIQMHNSFQSAYVLKEIAKIYIQHDLAQALELSYACSKLDAAWGAEIILEVQSMICEEYPKQNIEHTFDKNLGL